MERQFRRLPVDSRADQWRHEGILTETVSRTSEGARGCVPKFGSRGIFPIEIDRKRSPRERIRDARVRPTVEIDRSEDDGENKTERNLLGRRSLPPSDPRPANDCFAPMRRVERDDRQ